MIADWLGSLLIIGNFSLTFVTVPLPTGPFSKTWIPTNIQTVSDPSNDNWIYFFKINDFLKTGVIILKLKYKELRTKYRAVLLTYLQYSP